jgi:MFS family permease
MFSSFLLIPRFAQTPEIAGYGFAMSVTASGFLMAPTAAAQLVAGPLAGRVGARLGLRITLALGAALIAAAFVLLAIAHEHPWNFIVGGMALGAGITFALAGMANLIVESVPQSDVGIATGINTIMRTVGGAFGSAGGTAIVASHVGSSGLPEEGGYTVAFLASAVAGLLAIAAALLLPRTGQDARHERDERDGRADPARPGERLHA